MERKALYSVLIFFAISFSAFSQNRTDYVSATNGNWNTAGTWTPNGIPGNDDIVTIDHTIFLDTDIDGLSKGLDGLTVNTAGSITYSGTNGIKMDNGSILILSGDVTVYNFGFKGTCSVTINTGATITVDNSWYTQAENTGELVPFTVDGDLIVNGTFEDDGNIIDGTGSVYAATYDLEGAFDYFNQYTPGNPPANGDTIYGSAWSGAVSTIWGDPSNWYSGTVPTAQRTAPIPSGVPNFPVITSAAEVYSLIIHPGASVTIDPGYDLTIQETLNNDGSLILNSDADGSASFILNGPTNGSGTITYNRYVAHSGIDDQDFYVHQVCAPLDNQTLGDFDLITLSSYAYEYVPGGAPGYDYWNNIYDPSDPIPPLKGIILSIYENTTTGETATFSGNTADLVNSDQLATIAAGDTNLIGNPFISALDWESIYVDNSGGIGTTVYIWDPTSSSYKQYAWAAIGGTGDSSCRYIQPGQSFFATSSTASSLLINKTSRVHNHQSFLKNNTPNSLKISVSGINGSSDNTYIRFMNGESYTEDYDVDGEAKKWFSFQPEFSTELWTQSNDGYDLAINLLPSVDAKDYQVSMDFKACSTGVHKLKFSNLESFSQDVFIYLEDHLTGKIHNPRTEGAYVFNAGPDDPQERFNMHFRSSSFSVDEIIEHGDRLLVRNSGSTLEIQMESGNRMIKICVLDIQGNDVANYQDRDNIRIDLSLAAGVYIIQVITEQGQYSKKVSVW